MMKRVIAVLVLMMGLVSVTKAQRYTDGPILVPDHHLIAVFDGKTLTLSDLQGNVAQTIPIFDTNLVRAGLVYLYWSPTGGRFAIIAQAADLTDPFEKEASLFEIWQFSRDGTIDPKRLYTEKTLIPYTVGANFAWTGTDDFLVVKTTELPRNDSVYRYTISNDTVTFNSEILADVFIDHIIVSDNNRYLLSVINDQKIKIWDLQQNTLIGTTSDSVQIDSPPVFSPNSHEFVFVNPFKPNEIQIWNSDTVTLARKITVSSDVWGLEWGQGGIITIHYDGRIGITNTVSMQTRYTVSGLGEIDNFISWDESKTNFAMSSEVGGIQIRSGITGETVCCELSAEVQALRDTFKSEGCQRACWLGIEPDVTTQEEALEILTANGLIPNEIQELRAVSFKVEPNFPFIGELFNSGMVRFAYGRVDQIELPVNITLNQIKSAYGIPDRIIDRVDNVFQIVYASEGLVFETSDPNPDQIFRMYITNNYWLSSEYVAQPNFSTLITDCAQTPFLCDLIPNSDAQALRDMLMHPSCLEACWLSIEPGITPRAEVEKILAAHQVNYRVESFGGGLGNANDADTYMWLPHNESFINNNNGTSEAAIFFRNEIVVKIYLPVQIPVNTVTQAYGTADWVTVDSQGTYYDAVYEDEGLIFNLDTFLSTNITHISLEPSEALADLYMPTRECVLSDPVCRQFLGSVTPMPK